MPERHCKDARTHCPPGRNPGSAPAALGTVRPGGGQATLPGTHSWVSGTSLLRRHLGPQRLHFASASLLTSLVSAGGTRAAEAPQDTKLKEQTPLPQGTALCGDLLWPLPGPVLRRQWVGGLEFPSARGKTAGKAPATLASSDPLVKTFQFLSKDSLQIRFPPRPCWQKHGLWQHRDIACFWGDSDQPTSL